ncbi:MAG: ATP-dependent DNA helicase RecG [Deltaproteobacteria bacterium]|nr:ATP-dependent DNA helicase RecG [Deltaproteobacteria bacterium]
MPQPYRVTSVDPADCHHALQAGLEILKGVGLVRAAQLVGRGLATIEDLLYHLPFRYEDRRDVSAIAEVGAGESGSLVGRLTSLRAGRLRGGRRRILTAVLTDDTGSLELVWFNPPRYIADALRVGQRLAVYGRIAPERGARLSLPHPEFEILDEESERRPEVRPVYEKPGDVSQANLRGWAAQALERFGGFLPSFLPSELAERQGLMDLNQAMEVIHRPDSAMAPDALEKARTTARRSLAFDEFFYFQLALALRHRQRRDTPGFSSPARPGSLTARMRELLPYRLTGGQERVLREIYRDMESPNPMRRLLQGDVGSGKTVLAWLSALRAMENGRQALLLAPTELLAEQHYERLRPYAERLRIRSVFLSGSLPAAVRKEITERIGDGEVDFVVGTHALIQEGVSAPRMGLGIVDEQHRFGVSQRSAFARLSLRDEAAGGGAGEPDLLLMSATPIPRSLAMVLSGDLEVSLLDEAPPGRTPVRTVVVQEGQRQRVYERVRSAVADGRQAYLVYPLVEESQKMPMAAAESMARELSRTVMRGLRLGLVHGQMPTAERDQVMRRFRQGEIQVLVATTVIEVGIDVPGATLMVVEHAERFGLAQLHQLRGRVGRGRDESHCVLIHYGSRDDDSRRRLEVLEQAADGFEVAEADLRLRGAGEVLGTRQAGFQGFRVAHLVYDSEMLQAARQEAHDWLARNPSLRGKVSRRVREELRYRWGEAMQLGTWAD